MVYGGTGWEARYVSVIELSEPRRPLMPMRIIWDDSRMFECHVVRYRGVVRCRHQGRSAHCYEVLVDGVHKRRLYRDGAGWFVEVRVALEGEERWPPLPNWDPEA